MLEFLTHKYYQPVYDKDKVSFYVSPSPFLSWLYIDSAFVGGPPKLLAKISKDVIKLPKIEKKLLKEKQMTKKLKDLVEKQLPINKESFDLLVEACQFLIEESRFQAVIEPKIEPYVEWYEKHRADDTAPKSDYRTYRMCKMIVKIKKQLQTLNENSSELISNL